MINIIKAVISFLLVPNYGFLLWKPEATKERNHKHAFPTQMTKLSNS